MAVVLPSSESEVHTLLESAVSSRASHIRRESETITMANVRRLLESDLGLEAAALDAHKAFIRKLVDEVLLSSDNVEAEGGEEQETVSNEVPKETSGSKRLKKSSGKKAREENGSVEDFDDLQEDDMEIKESPKKKKQKEKKRRTSSKEVDENGGGSNAEMSEEELHVEAPKKKQRKERNEEISHSSKEVDEDGSGGRDLMSEEDSDVSEAKKAKKVTSIASAKPPQNKKIEHLKKIIKACGLNIPPHIYKRAKQQPDDKQDKFLIKELEDILRRRGLSSNPSDKEIKAAKQKIAREKDLEGIDTTNIIMEPRGRRATSQLFAPVYNPPPVEYDSEEDSEESEDGAEASEDEGNDVAVADDLEDSD